MRINTRHEIFSSVEACYAFLSDNELVSSSKSCVKCQGTMQIKLYGREGCKTIIYRCVNKGCQRRKSLINTKLKIHDYFLVVYKLLLGIKYREILAEVKTTQQSLVAIRKKMRIAYKKLLVGRSVLLGSVNGKVQCDETAICRRGIIRCPSKTADTIADTIWLLGCIDDSCPPNFFLKRIKNRQSETITNALEGVISVGSWFYTDGYPSYPQVALNLGLRHKVVNHTYGFVSFDGTHTNGIEGFWASVKEKMRNEHGILRENIDEWVDEFNFWKRYIYCKDIEDISAIFFEVLMILLN